MTHIIKIIHHDENERVSYLQNKYAEINQMYANAADDFVFEYKEHFDTIDNDIIDEQNNFAYDDDAMGDMITYFHYVNCINYENTTFDAANNETIRYEYCHDENGNLIKTIKTFKSHIAGA